MAINYEMANKIDSLYGEGCSNRNIALEVGLNREKVRRYLKGEINITDTENAGFDTKTHNNTNSTDNKAYLNEQLETFKAQIQTEFIGVKADILDYIKEELPLNKSDLIEIKKENKQIKGKIEFLKKVLKEFNPIIYKRVCDETLSG